jgi:hypothetical protein
MAFPSRLSYSEHQMLWKMSQKQFTTASINHEKEEKK